LSSEESINQVLSARGLKASAAQPRVMLEEENNGRVLVAREGEGREGILEQWPAIGHMACFFGVLILVSFAFNGIITSGFRRVKTSEFGALNDALGGKVNAQIVITGSSRAAAHYDPRVIEALTGHSAFNLGRNGSQTDMQVAFLKAYLAHNRRPEIVIHNLDSFTFVTTREVYDPVQYTPYLYDRNLYDALRKINPNTWKDRYVPLYGYVVEDMRLTWITGLKGFAGWSPPEDHFLGFNPRSAKWSQEFQNFKAANPNGVRFDIEPAGIEVMKDLISVCRQNGIQLIFVYSPEYSEMQSLTKNRADIFNLFHELAAPAGIPVWDYSDWKYSDNQAFFQNSQHLNATGAEVFSEDVANRLKTYSAARFKAAQDEHLPVATTIDLRN